MRVVVVTYRSQCWRGRLPCGPSCLGWVPTRCCSPMSRCSAASCTGTWQLPPCKKRNLFKSVDCTCFNLFMSVFIYTVYLTLVYMAVRIMILKFLWFFFLYKKYRTTCFSIIKYRVYKYVSKFLTQFMLSEIEYLYAHRGLIK